MKFKYPFKKMLNILTSLDDPIWFKILYTSSNNSEKLGKYLQSGGGRGGEGFVLHFETGTPLKKIPVIPTNSRAIIPRIYHHLVEKVLFQKKK